MKLFEEMFLLVIIVGLVVELWLCQELAFQPIRFVRPVL